MNVSTQRDTVLERAVSLLFQIVGWEWWTGCDATGHGEEIDCNTPKHLVILIR